jgi:hypothetical protein
MSIDYGSILAYGDAGAGKTAFAASAFYDWKKGKTIRDGRLLVFGREGNSALGIPEENVKRFRSPKKDPLKFLTEFNLYMEALVVQLEKGTGPEVIALDGWSEWNQTLLFEYDAKGSDDYWAKFDEAKNRFFAIQRMLDPEEFHIWVLATARVDEKKKGAFSKRTNQIEGADPDYMQGYKYIPAMVGWAKKNMAHYSDIVTYVEAEPGDVRTPSGILRKATHHNYYMIQSGDYLVKNRWEHKWLATDQPDYLTNPLFDDMLDRLNAAESGYAELQTEA